MMLESVITEFLCPLRRYKNPQVRRNEASRWIFGEYLTFEECCEIGGLDPDELRRAIRRLVARNGNGHFSRPTLGGTATVGVIDDILRVFREGA